MAKAKRVVRRAWTKDDVRTMKTMAKAKSGVAKIAKALETNSRCNHGYGGKTWGIPFDAGLRACLISELFSTARALYKSTSILPNSFHFGAGSITDLGPPAADPSPLLARPIASAGK